MGLSRIRIHHVRNIQHADLVLSPGLNVIEGNNGSGKTSFLEAIFLLGRAKSFRTQTANKLICEQGTELVVAGETTLNSVPSQIGLKKTRDTTEIRINGQDCKRVSELVSRFPIQLIRPESHILLEGSPGLRRSFLDWGLFHVKHDYLVAYKRYQRALSQRNALLRQQRTGGLQPWNRELNEYGTILQHARDAYVQRLNIEFQTLMSEFYPSANVTVDYHPGWDRTLSLLQALESSADSDLMRGYTRHGPHRGDLVLKSEGIPARDRLSRGQSKLVVLSLNLAQTVVYREVTRQQAIVLVDDLAAELDDHHLGLTLRCLSELDAQVFVTTTQADRLPVDKYWTDKKVFHVEQGDFKEKAFQAA